MLQFQPVVTIADVINAVLLVSALIGIFLTYKQITKQKRQRSSRTCIRQSLPILT